jgi:hypothetical protein
MPPISPHLIKLQQQIAEPRKETRGQFLTNGLPPVVKFVPRGERELNLYL